LYPYRIKNVGRWLTDQLKGISTEEHKVRQRKVTLARIGNLPVTGVQNTRKEELAITTTVETRTVTHDHGVIPQEVPGITVLCPPVESISDVGLRRIEK